MANRNTSNAKPPAWANYAREKLLDVRLCDLGLTIEGSTLQRRLDKLHRELAARNITFRPHCWISDEWFTPLGIPGIAIPFYLAHPTLLRLERSMMLDAEGGDAAWCMRILRHEAGHAVQYAYRLDRRRRWRELFGRHTTPYPQTYRPTPHTRDHVLHLDNWYAQAHPDEDFAETFAVWLTPGSDWREHYAGWPALDKLEYVDELMGQIAHQTPTVRSRLRVSPIESMRRTLGAHYRARLARPIAEPPPPHDHDLRRLFDELESGASASVLMRRRRRAIVATIAHWTGEYQLAIDRTYGRTLERCRALKLRVPPHADELSLERDLTALLTVQTMGRLHTEGHRLTL